MKKFNLEKFSASSCVAAAIISFAAIIDVQAGPVFPPDHRSAGAAFGQASQRAPVNAAGPWYFQGLTSRPGTFDIHTEDASLGPQVAATSEIESWYRAAN